MRKALSFAVIAALVAAAPLSARAAEDDAPPDPAPIFAVGGTPLSNGIFLPGTAIWDGEEYQGVPYKLEPGQDLMFTNLDNGDVANAHQIRSFKRKKKTGRPVFQSKRLSQPGEQSKVLVAHLKPGVYDFFCPIHTGMYGWIEIPPRDSN